MAPAPIKTNFSPSERKHTSRPSEETNASAITGSAISYSAFPEPPSSIPPTPRSFGTPGFSPRTFHFQQLEPPQVAASYRFSQSTFGGESSKPSSSKRTGRDNDVTSVSTSNISPHDWHEGASSIDVDTAEDRLLPTSFITSLLQEHIGPRGANRASQFSGVSEMTYPPRNPLNNSLHDSSMCVSSNPLQGQFRRQSYRGPPPRPVGGQTPESAENHKQKCASDDCKSSSHTVHEATYSTSGSERTLHAEQSAICGENGDTIHSEIQGNSFSGIATPPIQPIRPNLTLNVNDELYRQKLAFPTESAAPTVVSRVSSSRSFRQLLTWRRKRLPTIPVIQYIPNVTEREQQTINEREPLSNLVGRANRLHNLLEKDYHPHQSPSSHQAKSGLYVSSYDEAENLAPLRKRGQFQPPSSSRYSRAIFWVKSHKLWLAVGIFIVISVITVGSTVGVTQRRGAHGLSCPSGMAGANCNFNATCICTGGSSSCNPVARVVLDILPTMNGRLSTNVTINTVYKTFWTIQGGVQGDNCVSQVNSIDVSPIDYQTYPNRTQWAQAALLWTLVQTVDPNLGKQLQTFISKAHWEQLQNSDGPILSAGTAFTTSVAGFSYDFAAQTITALPATFTAEGHPSDTQVSRIDSRIRPSLDYLYSYAVSSSKQRDNALLNYWTTVLHQKEEMLKPFMDAFSASPILLPFDATSQSLQRLYQSSSFPPPAACRPGLTPDEEDAINSVEGKAFDLPQANLSTSSFNMNCFPLHPTYGILNVLRLRLPFLGSQNNIIKQALVLKPDAAPRAALAVGVALGDILGPTNSTSVDPRNYGTIAHANHVVLQYLSSVPSQVANAIVEHVLNSSKVPIPPQADSKTASALFPLENIPSLGVAVFGNIEASDVESYVSSFTSSDSLFFGSSSGSTFRTWAIGRGRIAWTENATSPEVVYDSTFSDEIFNKTWAAASIAIETNAPNVGVENITDSFRVNQRFSP